MRVTKLDNGRLIISVRGEGPGGEIVEGTEDIGPRPKSYFRNQATRSGSTTASTYLIPK